MLQKGQHFAGFFCLLTKVYLYDIQTVMSVVSKMLSYKSSSPTMKSSA